MVQSTMNYELWNSSAGRATVLGCAALLAVLSKNTAWSLAVTMNTYGFGTPGASLNQLRLLRWATTLIDCSLQTVLYILFVMVS